MAEPRSEQILEALKAQLQGIVGDGGSTFWWTPTAVVRGDFDDDVLDASLGSEAEPPVIYLLSLDDQLDEDETFQATRCELHVDLLVARRFTPATENPHEVEVLAATDPTMRRQTVQNRLVADAKRALRGNFKLTSVAAPEGLSLHIRIPLTEKGAQDTYTVGWAIAFLRLEVLFDGADQVAS